jgi:lipopolysaccharide export system protein LptA
MASSRNSPALWLAAALVLGLPDAGPSGAVRAAEPACANPEIEIGADEPADIDLRNNNALLRNVVITQCDKRIEAAEARITGGIDFDNSRWVLSGNVRVRAEGGSLSSDKAVVTFRDQLIAQATLTGEPAELSQPREDGTVTRARARTIEYETASGTVSFRDDAWLSYGCNELSGQVLTYNIRAQRMEAQPAAARQAGNGRIIFRIQPKDQAGNPCASPGAEKKP